MTSGPPEEVLTDERLDSLEHRMDKVEKWQTDAVPAGDHVGHCRYHQLMIEGIEGRKRLRQAIIEKTIPGLILAFLGFLALAAWAYFKSLVVKP